MTDYRDFVADRWQQIESSGVQSTGGWRSMTVPVVADGRDVIQAVDDSGQHHLLIPADSTRHPENTRSPLAMSFRNFRFSTGDATDVEGRYFDIHCRLPALNGQFDRVIGEVIASVEGSKSPVGAAAATLAAWRRLFATLADSRPLTYLEKVAAFGELSVLQDFVESRHDFRATFWTGPKREPHDFELEDVSVEVKSLGDDSDTITVHGLAQLARSDGKPLFITVRRVVESASGRTLSELLGEILHACDDPLIVRDRAARLGVYEEMDDTTRFEVVERLIGEVDEQFPKITEATLGEELAGLVSRVSYDMQLADLREHLTPGSVDAIGDDTQ